MSTPSMAPIFTQAILAEKERFSVTVLKQEVQKALESVECWAEEYDRGSDEAHVAIWNLNRHITDLKLAIYQLQYGDSPAA